jgi:adenine-specific DNA-methyltransferase
MNNKIISFIEKYTDNLKMANKLIIGSFLEYNKLKVKNNKLIKSSIEGNEKNIVLEFTKLIEVVNGKYDFEDLTELFEITIPSTDVVVNGAVYTPEYIKSYIVENAINSIPKYAINNIMIADIACGTGAFLHSAVNQIKAETNKSYSQIFKENIFGLDISEYTIQRAKMLLSLLAIINGEDELEFNFNLFVGNTLDFNWKNKIDDFIGFDIIVGNPPYVRAKNLSKESIELMSKWEVTKSGNPDLYIPFFEIGLHNLKQDGILSFITVNTFKRSVNARNLRSFFKDNQFSLSIIDFGNEQIFKNKSTYTCIVSISKIKTNYINYVKAKADNIRLNKLNDFSSIDYKLLDSHRGWMLNSKEILENIYKIENTGISLGNKFLIKNGLATLSNDLFIFKPIDEDDKYFYLKRERIYKIEKDICKDIIKPNRLKFESELLELKEKIIFPYWKDSNNKFTVFSEDYFKEEFPDTYKYLKDNKKQLDNRDKGKVKKYKWYEFGRSQAINDYGLKLLFPYIAKQPYFVFSKQEDLLLYAGYGIFSQSEEELSILKRILESKVFWYYILHTSKPYSGNYYALSKNYVKDFSLCELSKEERFFLLNEVSKDKIDEFLIKKYEVNI